MTNWLANILAVGKEIGNFATLNINYFHMKLLEGKVALITGATRGIGKAIALKFASEGADIAFTGRNITEAVEETVRQIESYGVKAKVYASDASDYNQAHELVKEIHK